MKALRCDECGDIVRPHSRPGMPRACLCGRHSVWFVDAQLRNIVIRDQRGRNDCASILRIYNGLLGLDGDTSADAIASLLASVNHRYFTAQRSLVVKTSVEASDDAAWFEGG